MTWRGYVDFGGGCSKVEPPRQGGPLKCYWAGIPVESDRNATTENFQGQPTVSASLPVLISSINRLSGTQTTKIQSRFQREQ
jgi:hypothetical protein